MKSPLVYLTVTKLKNQLIAVVKSPAKLIYAVILVALFGLTAFSGSAYDLAELRNPQELVAIMTLFYTMMFLMVFALSLIHISVLVRVPRPSSLPIWKASMV